MADAYTYVDYRRECNRNYMRKRRARLKQAREAALASWANHPYPRNPKGNYASLTRHLDAAHTSAPVNSSEDGPCASPSSCSPPLSP